jgi:gentisate 1,2-dioxygenase
MTELISHVTAGMDSRAPQDAAEGLLRDLEYQHTKPLWAQMAKLNPPLPNPTAVPHVWRYDKLRPHLLHAGHLITEKQAERRVLMLVNPARGRFEWRHGL